MGSVRNLERNCPQFGTKFGVFYKREREKIRFMATFRKLNSNKIWEDNFYHDSFEGFKDFLVTYCCVHYCEVLGFGNII